MIKRGAVPGSLTAGELAAGIDSGVANPAGPAVERNFMHVCAINRAPAEWWMAATAVNVSLTAL
jgi:hypothetical protein